MASANVSAMTTVIDHNIRANYEPFEFLAAQPELYIILVTSLVIASVVGTCGNVLILVAIATQRDLQNVESVFVVNLACCDLYVTVVFDPLSIVGKLKFLCFVHMTIPVKTLFFLHKEYEQWIEGDVDFLYFQH